MSNVHAEDTETSSKQKRKNKDQGHKRKKYCPTKKTRRSVGIQVCTAPQVAVKRTIIPGPAPSQQPAVNSTTVPVTTVSYVRSRTVSTSRVASYGRKENNPGQTIPIVATNKKKMSSAAKSKSQPVAVKSKNIPNPKIRDQTTIESATFPAPGLRCQVVLERITIPCSASSQQPAVNNTTVPVPDLNHNIRPQSDEPSSSITPKDQSGRTLPNKLASLIREEDSSVSSNIECTRRNSQDKSYYNLNETSVSGKQNPCCSKSYDAGDAGPASSQQPAVNNTTVPTPAARHSTLVKSRACRSRKRKSSRSLEKTIRNMLLSYERKKAYRRRQIKESKLPFRVNSRTFPLRKGNHKTKVVIEISDDSDDDCIEVVAKNDVIIIEDLDDEAFSLGSLTNDSLPDARKGPLLRIRSPEEINQLYLKTPKKF